MLEAFVWGALGASALLLGPVVAYVFAPGRQVIGVVMALGTGRPDRLSLVRAALDPAGGANRRAHPGIRGGCLLAMVADTLLPEAFEVEGVWTGLLVVVGFAVSIALSAI